MELLTLTVSASEMAAFAPIEKMPDTEQPPRKTLKEMGLKFNRTNDKSISEGTGVVYLSSRVDKLNLQWTYL